MKCKSAQISFHYLWFTPIYNIPLMERACVCNRFIWVIESCRANMKNSITIANHIPNRLKFSKKKCYLVLSISHSIITLQLSHRLLIACIIPKEHSIINYQFSPITFHLGKTLNIRFNCNWHAWLTGWLAVCEVYRSIPVVVGYKLNWIPPRLFHSMTLKYWFPDQPLHRPTTVKSYRIEHDEYLINFSPGTSEGILIDW